MAVEFVPAAGAVWSWTPTWPASSKAQDLGTTADDYCRLFCLRYRNHHRLTKREYPIMRMLAGESFPDLVVEVSPIGINEPRWTHLVHDVVMDEDDGDPDCLALVIQDVSERYDAEGRFEAMFQANPAPALILRLSDQRFIRVKAGFAELCGCPRDAIEGHHLRDLDILAHAERHAFVAERLAAGGTIPQVESEIPLPDGSSTLVILAGQPTAAPVAGELSQREREVLELVCERLDNAAIAEKLKLTVNTVRNHVSRLYAKIGVKRRSAAVIWARERGIGGRAGSSAGDR